MAFIQFRHGERIQGMTVHDLPDDVRIFRSRERLGFVSALMIASNTQISWEYELSGWRTFDNELDYAIAHGIEIDRAEAAAIEATGSLKPDAHLLQLPEGM